MKLKLKEFNQFCSSSSIHGVQYFATDGEATTCDKIIWFAALATSLGICFLLLVNMNSDWSDNPVITTIESTSEPLTNIPYPSISICNNGLDIWAFNQRVLNYIDIDCGPDGICPDDVIKARNDFRKVFEAAWNKTIQTVDESQPELSSFEQRCPDDKSYSKNNYSDLLCIAAGLMFRLNQINNNSNKSADVIKNITDTLARGHLFVNVSLARMNEEIVDKIERELGLTNNVNEAIRLNLVCSDINADDCNKVLNETVKFYFKIGALTSRVSKLGTLMVWADAYDHVKSYFNYLGKRMAPNSKDIDFKELIMRLSSGQYSDNPQDDFDRMKKYDLTSPSCKSNLSNTCSNENKCCCDNSACNTGSLDLVFKAKLAAPIEVMKEASRHPHLLDLDERLRTFSGNILDGSYPIRPPPYITEELIGYKLIGSQSFKDQKFRHQHFMTPEPLIPFCKINEKWSVPPKHGAENVFESSTSFCTLFRPTLTDSGICHTMNLFNRNPLKPSAYVKQFEEIFSGPYNKELEERDLHPTGAGKSAGIKLLIDAHTLTNKVNDYKKGKGKTFDNSFHLYLHESSDVALNKIYGGLKVTGGSKFSLVISPVWIKSSDEVKALKVEDRKCGVDSDQHQGNFLFQNYRHTACLYTCVLQKAYDACRCIPWNFPNTGPKGEERPLCDFNGAGCFLKMFDNTSLITNCTNCIGDCDQIMYNFNTLKETLTEENCDRADNKAFLRDYFMNYEREPQMEDFMAFVNGARQQDDFELCKRRLPSDIIIIEVYFASPFITKYKRDIQMPLAGKISNIGGMLGLFCGMSFLSIFEIFFWMIKAGLEILKRGRHRAKK